MAMATEFRSKSHPDGQASQFDTDLAFEVCRWAREYSKHDGGNSVMRFAIGVYQIGQAVGWKDGDGAVESACAACLHFIGAAEMCRVDMYTFLPILFSFARYAHEEYDASRLLRAIATAQQQHVYIARCAPGSVRANRINLHTLGQATAEVVRLLLSRVPRAARSAGFASEIEKLSASEWKRSR